MDYVKKYGELIKDKAGVKPERARSMIRLGLRAENARTKLLPNKEMPKAFRMLTHLAMESVLQALDHPEKSCWTNIFAPVEIMQCFGLQCVSMECLSSFMSGFKIEDYLIDYAQNEGIASTLCSYHKNFIGGVDSGVLPKAAMSVTTSMICDGNSRMSPGICPRNNILHIGNAVHITHLCMAMQFHTLYRTVIHSAFCKIRNLFNTGHGTDGQVMVIFIYHGDAF